MKTPFTLRSCVTGLLAFLATTTVNAQFHETMGTNGFSPESIMDHETNNRFSVTALTYTGSGDMRTSAVSSGYTTCFGPASGGFNVLLQAQETFEIATIDASHCTTSNTICFGIFKSTTSSNGNDFLKLEYETNNSGVWTALPYMDLPTGNGTSKWYARSVTLPAGAIASNLHLRFRNTLVGTSSSNPQFRIDDVSMDCGSIICSGLGLTATAAIVSGSAVFCENTSSATIAVTTGISSPSYKWYNQDGLITAQTTSTITVDHSGTYYAVVTDASGCQAVTGQIYIHVYPTPGLCEACLTGNTGTVVTFCPTLRTADLLISEYIDGPGFNKYLELYNGTCEPLHSGDYEIHLYANGSTVPTTVIPLIPDVSILPGTTYVIANDKATIPMNPLLNPVVNRITSLLDFNGNDAIELTNLASSSTVDIFGSIGHNPGVAWTATSPPISTAAQMLVRIPCIYSGITVNPDLPGPSGFPALASEWQVVTTPGLGSHTFGASSFNFNITSGTSTIVSKTANCADVFIDAGISILSVDPVLCTFNSCGPIDVPITNACRQASHKREELSEMGLQAFPNPFSDNTTIEFTQKQDGAVAVTITDLAGHVVLAKTVQATAGKQRVELSLSELATGSYVCTIVSAQGQETVRIVKSK